ncbi:predicted protein [Streptomyces viridosporus ATCC 14672]|uniref:Predicted protein n=1 Tax=Streptomyces viridosporus (strain ATCC 14672 / DSM 40746 / JCM 4963 / KCTC 9882 / NRRL B-12104 / FH 1290) TaxID=566461 RepID=D5ZNP5_STRV1|nr:predicted protein [Streptomyces viridosporus ATCC 14672]
MEQAEVEVGSYLVADPEAFELVEPGEGSLDDPLRWCRSTGDVRRAVLRSVNSESRVWNV